MITGPLLTLKSLGEQYRTHRAIRNLLTQMRENQRQNLLR